jgi:hypothetical protein
MGFNDETAYLGPIYRLAEAMGSGYAKGAAVLSGAENSVYSAAANTAEKFDLPGSAAARYLQQGAQANEDTARGIVNQLTPNAATTGGAVQLLHSLGEGAELMATGAAVGGVPGAALVTGGVEGGSRYQELKEQGVDTKTAAESAGLTGVVSAAGTVLPAAYGSSLVARLLTGAASNTALGVANRYSDHTILEAGGYHEMADQQKVWDGSQILTDLALGTTFGAIHHAFTPAESRAAAALRSPQNEDAALAANLAQRDRYSAPGVPVNPDAANAHQQALQKATSDLLQGNRIDVSDTGVNHAEFLSRPSPAQEETLHILLSAFKESGLVDEEASLRDLENQLAARRGEPQQPAIERPARAPDDHYADIVHRESDNFETPEAESEYEGTLRSESTGEGSGETQSDTVPARGASAESAQESGDLGPQNAPEEAGAKTRGTVEQALSERPDLELPAAAGGANEQAAERPVAHRASDALAQADDELAVGEKELPVAIKAATDCFARRGTA